MQSHSFSLKDCYDKKTRTIFGKSLQLNPTEINEHESVVMSLPDLCNRMLTDLDIVEIDLALFTSYLKPERILEINQSFYNDFVDNNKIQKFDLNADLTKHPADYDAEAYPYLLLIEACLRRNQKYGQLRKITESKFFIDYERELTNLKHYFVDTMKFFGFIVQGLATVIFLPIAISFIIATIAEMLIRILIGRTGDADDEVKFTILEIDSLNHDVLFNVSSVTSPNLYFFISLTFIAVTLLTSGMFLGFSVGFLTAAALLPLVIVEKIYDRYIDCSITHPAKVESAQDELKKLIEQTSSEENCLQWIKMIKLSNIQALPTIRNILLRQFPQLKEVIEHTIINHIEDFVNVNDVSDVETVRATFIKMYPEENNRIDFDNVMVKKLIAMVDEHDIDQIESIYELITVNFPATEYKVKKMMYKRLEELAHEKPNFSYPIGKLFMADDQVDRAVAIFKMTPKGNQFYKSAMFEVGHAAFIREDMIEAKRYFELPELASNNEAQLLLASIHGKETSSTLTLTHLSFFHKLNENYDRATISYVAPTAESNEAPTRPFGFSQDA